MDTWLDPQWLVPIVGWSVLAVYVVVALCVVVSRVNDYRYNRQIDYQQAEEFNTQQSMRLNADRFDSDRSDSNRFDAAQYNADIDTRLRDERPHDTEDTMVMPHLASDRFPLSLIVDEDES
jgi:hypothetical protein